MEYRGSVAWVGLTGPVSLGRAGRRPTLSPLCISPTANRLPPTAITYLPALSARRMGMASMRAKSVVTLIGVA